VFSSFLLKTFVRRVNRRMLVRIVKLWRSTWLVEMWAGSGRPAINVRATPVTGGGHNGAHYRRSHRVASFDSQHATKTPFSEQWMY
jgi:hypothetical protein